MCWNFYDHQSGVLEESFNQRVQNYALKLSAAMMYIKQNLVVFGHKWELLQNRNGNYVMNVYFLEVAF
jgi:hypothetical protein